MITRLLAVLLVLAVSACGNIQTSEVSEKNASDVAVSPISLVKEATKTIRTASEKAVEISKGTFESKEQILAHTNTIKTGINALALAIVSLKLDKNSSKEIDGHIKELRNTHKRMEKDAGQYINYDLIKYEAQILDSYLLLIEVKLIDLGFDIKSR